MATHPSILAWTAPWTEEAGGLQSMGSQRVRHDGVSVYTRLPTLPCFHSRLHRTCDFFFSGCLSSPDKTLKVSK